MDTGRQIIRWSIPGTVYLLGLLTILMIYVAINELSLLVSMFGTKENAKIAIPYVLLIAAIIPLGYVIYQLYYWIYGNVIRGFNLVAIDKGSIVLSKMSQDVLDPILERQRSLSFSYIERNITPSSDESSDVKNADYYSYIVDVGILRKFLPQLRKLKKTFRNSEGRRDFRLHFFGHWDMVRYWVQEQEDDRLRFEYTNHFDIFHSLGACILAIYLSLLSSVVGFLCLEYAGVFNESNFVTNFAATSLILILSMLLVKIFDSNRRAALYSILALLMHHIEYCDQREKTELFDG